MDVRFLAGGGSGGPTDQRNVGWRATSAPLVAFTDDDCRPSPRWLERLLAAAEGQSFLQGRTEPDPDERHLLRGLARTRSVIGPSPWFPCCNMAYPRLVLQELGGFDESFVFGAEDTDLALPAPAAGSRCRYVDDAVIWHAVLSRNALSAARDAFAAPTFPLLLAKHPYYRRHLYLAAFRNRTHATLSLGLAAGALLRHHRALATAALMPYLADMVRGNLVPGRRSPRAVARLAAHLPARFLIDLLEIVGTARAAASHRVAML